jgi:hypothetical protein
MRLLRGTVTISSIVVWAFACSAPAPGEGAASDELGLGLGAPQGGENAAGGDCTLTQGYWKTHDAAWPVDTLVIGGQSYSQAELLDLLWTPVMGDGSLLLAHQLIAAMLNVANGATPTGAIADADAWMAANADADGRLPYGVPPNDEVSSLGDALAAFNEGTTGPGHCDDNPGGGEGGGSSTGTGGSGETGDGGESGGTECSDCTTDEQCGTNAFCSNGCCFDIAL